MIVKQLISFIYEAASIQRWNDHIRPWNGFSELDKQAHKMYYAYVLAKCETEQKVDYVKLIEGGIFEFFHRIIMTDIKPPIFHQLMNEKGKQINDWVLQELSDILNPINNGFYDRMVLYYNDESYSKLEKEILRAANYQATNWEFNVIYPSNLSTFGIEQVKKEMTTGLASCDTFSGFKYFMGSPYLKDFLSLLGKLRYQQRWSKAARLPGTFVMGHMLVVAILAYFCSLEINACEKRKINNFFGGLFHDLPEVLTRDIVSPVKSSVKGLDDIIKEIEESQMNKIILPLLPKSWHEEIIYYTKNEFSSKVILENETVIVTTDEINETFDDNKYNGIDGEIIRCCDHLSAFLEAYLSIDVGVYSIQMTKGYENLFKLYKDKKVGGIDFGQIFRYYTFNKSEE